MGLTHFILPPCRPAYILRSAGLAGRHYACGIDKNWEDRWDCYPIGCHFPEILKKKIINDKNVNKNSKNSRKFPLKTRKKCSGAIALSFLDATFVALDDLVKFHDRNFAKVNVRQVCRQSWRKPTFYSWNRCDCLQKMRKTASCKQRLPLFEW